VLAIEDGVAQRMFTARFNTDVLLGFATLALVLACLGVHATVSYVVARRRRELAIRMAVGASAGEVIRHVVGATNRVLLPGLITGGVGSIATARLLRSMLYGADGLDPLMLVGVSIVMWGAGIFAAYLPARRAALADVVLALRAD
jgi:ABC-type antimicrobial peptide transport system permease subunit